ncbi:unnamed protein product [Peniophora sp. CBMAI 1063]|nr:unnamed protein product [Peniophora sp. CBMAI 1063]
MARAVDPTYPLYPSTCILSAGLLLAVISTRLTQKSWNLGVTLLCVWVFLDNVTLGTNAILWADNANVRLRIYCDITSRIQLIASIVKPMATLIIIRQLYLITKVRPAGHHDKAVERGRIKVDWILGVVVPVLVAGPLYYVVEVSRFEVEEGFGCGNSVDDSILSVLLLTSWTTAPPLICVVVYYPKIIWTFYHQSREINHFLRNDAFVPRISYFRILALASIDVLCKTGERADHHHAELSHAQLGHRICL